jgi:hypothetical protein
VSKQGRPYTHRTLRRLAGSRLPGPPFCVTLQVVVQRCLYSGTPIRYETTVEVNHT